MQFDQATLQQAHRERDRLLRECHALLERVARRPYYLKLLQITHRFLLGMLEYKAQRRRFSPIKAA